MIEREKWVKVNLDVDNDAIINFELQVSNLGRVRKVYSGGKISNLKGSMHDGYSILKLKVLTYRTEQDTLLLKQKKQQIKQIQTLIKRQETIIKNTTDQQKKYEIHQEVNALKTLQLDLDKEYRIAVRNNNLKRTKNLALLYHRLVATAFCEKQHNDQLYVLHKDHNKYNNRAENLAWCTQEELTEHWKKNPHVKAAHDKRKGVIPTNAKNIKLTIPKVMLIKKLLAEGMTLSKIAKMFHITSTQVKRIKTGENWAKIAPAN